MKMHVKVIPNSKKNEVVESGRDLFGEVFLKVKIAAVPEDGKANKMLINVVADFFKVRRRNVTIISGFTSGNKILDVLMNEDSEKAITDTISDKS